MAVLHFACSLKYRLLFCIIRPMTQENLQPQNGSVDHTETQQPPDLAKLRQQLQEISAVSPAQLLNTMSEHFEHTAKTISEIDSEEKKAA